MLIKEYRIPLPLTLEEYRIAQLYMIQKKSREESDGEDSGVEIIENRPYEEGPFGSGQYTYKLVAKWSNKEFPFSHFSQVYHIGRHIPSWFRSVVPKTALEVHEESWNAYPCTKTKFSVPFVEKFTLEVDTIFQPDRGEQENIFKLKPSELRQRELDVIDIVNDSLTGSDYEEEEDPSLFQSTNTGRGPLAQDWIQNPPNGVIMCSYKLIKVEFRYWGLQSRIERFIHDYGLRRVMLRAHRQAWSWQDEWVGLTMADIRRLELETQEILKRKLGRSVSISQDLEEQVEHIEEEESSTIIDGSKDDPPKRKEQSEGNECVTSPQRRHTGSKRRPNSGRRHFNNSSSHYQTSSPIDAQQKGGNVPPDENNSVYSYYALDTIAINDDSDTEYFDAQEIIKEEDSSEEDSSDEEFDDPMIELLDRPSIGATPYGVQDDLSPDFLFLVVHGGCGLQPGTVDSTNHDIDFRTLKGTLQEVLNTHYQFARGRVTIKSVPSPNIGSKAYDILSSLSPAYTHHHVQTTPPSMPSPTNFSFPIGALPILACSDPSYSLSLRQLVITTNIIYRDFLESDEGRCFNGHICILADCLGSVMIYDILSRHGDTSPATSPATTPTNPRRVTETVHASPTNWRRQHSPNEGVHRKPQSLNLHRIGSPEQHSSSPVVGIRLHERISTGFMFDVSSVFMFGSPLGYILSHRHMTGYKVPHPRCSSIYNMFYSVDPLAARLEPILDQLFSTISPISIPSYGKYPTGDRSSVNLKATVSKYPDLFQSSNQSSSLLSPSSSNGPKRASSTEYLAETEGTIQPKNDLRPFCSWWSDYRIDYQLEVPAGLESSECLPNTAYAHIVQARYWEAKEMFSFILRQMLQSHTASVISASNSPTWVPFVPPTSTVKWAKKKTPLRIQRMSPNHRAVDVVLCSLSNQSPPTLQAKFFYGPLNMAPLSGEMVDIYLLTHSDEEGASKTENSWLNIATVSTDKHGRASYEMSLEESPCSVGVYPVIFLVKGDHTIACCSIFVLPPHTEAVVFSIDGALTSNFSLSGRDMKLRNGVLEVARLWQDLGYLIIYITSRPDIQKEYVTSWLGLHGFPMGVVSFSDSLSTDPNNIKLVYLARLIKEAKIILSTAYGSQRHLAMFRELGLQSDQIFIHSKGGNKKVTGFNKKPPDGDCMLIDGFDSHYSTLKGSPPRPAAVCVKDTVGEFSFSFPGSLSKDCQPATSSSSGKSKRPRSSSTPKEGSRKNSS